MQATTKAITPASAPATPPTAAMRTPCAMACLREFATTHDSEFAIKNSPNTASSPGSWPLSYELFHWSDSTAPRSVAQNVSKECDWFLWPGFSRLDLLRTTENPGERLFGLAAPLYRSLHQFAAFQYGESSSISQSANSPLFFHVLCIDLQRCYQKVPTPQSRNHNAFCSLICLITGLAIIRC